MVFFAQAWQATPSVNMIGRISNTAAAASKCRASGSGLLYACVGTPSRFVITAAYEYGVQCTSGGLW